LGDKALHIVLDPEEAKQLSILLDRALNTLDPKKWPPFMAQRATCAKLKVGCVLVDSKQRIIGSGYNGVARGEQHCTDLPCIGAYAPKGADLCEAIHAETNALLTCKDADNIDTCYTTHAPCMRCTKTLLNTGCKHIVFLHGDNYEPAARQLWLKANRSWYNYIELAARAGVR
jgi:dCMP deaminase